nr:MAG TPA: hypothetical protein [Caudoviricetes sp.]
MNPITQGCAAFAVLTVKPFIFRGNTVLRYSKRRKS